MTSHTSVNHERASRSRLAGVGALMALSLWLLAPTTAPHVARVSGRVEIGSGEPPVWRAAHDGDALAPGDLVRTGRDGRAELLLAAGSVRLYGDSLVRLPASAPARGAAESIGLESGKSLFDVFHREKRGFEVRTPEVVVSIKGTRFLVASGEQAEVSVFHGTVGVRPKQDPARELLVREGFALVGGADRAFDLRWSGAADPWETWLGGALPPAAPGPAGASGESAPSEVEAARAAAGSESRRGAVKEAVERHPDVAERVEDTVKEKVGALTDVVPAAPAPDPSNRGSGSSGGGIIGEQYIENLLNGGSSGSGGGGSSGSGGSGSSGSGGSSGPSFGVEVVDDAVVVTQGSQSWTLSEADLEAIEGGQTTLLPQPLETAIGAQGATVEEFATQALKLLD